MTDTDHQEAIVEATHSFQNPRTNTTCTVTFAGTAQEVRTAEQQYFAADPVPAPDATN